MTGNLLSRWATLITLVIAIDAVLAVLWLVAFTDAVKTLQALAGLLQTGICVPVGIILPFRLRTALLPIPHRRLLCAGLGAATGLFLGLVTFIFMTLGIAVLQEFGQSYPYLPTSPWVWPLLELVATGLLSGVTGLFVLRVRTARETPTPAPAGVVDPPPAAPETAEPSGPISPDGRWRWDGSRWLPCGEQQRAVYSEDGRWYWEGTRWVPTETPPGS